MKKFFTRISILKCSAYYDLLLELTRERLFRGA